MRMTVKNRFFYDAIINKFKSRVMTIVARMLLRFVCYNQNITDCTIRTVRHFITFAKITTITTAAAVQYRVTVTSMWLM